jgi:hypothetical protein
MASREQLPPGNVVSFRGDGQTQRKPRDAPIGPHLPSTIARLREIAELSGDHLVTEGPVHPDHQLLDLCAAALDLVQQAEDASVQYRQQAPRLFDAWTEADVAANRAARDRQKALNVAATQFIRRAHKLKATTPAGVYAKALLVRASITGARVLGRSLAEDLIACDGLRESLIWPEAQGEARP